MSEPPSRGAPARVSRRAALAMLSGLLVAPPFGAARAEPTRLKVGLLEFGTASWLVETMRAEGLDRAHDLVVETVMLASNDAARIAFQSGAVDTIVSDLIFAGRRSAEGRPTVFAPLSTAEGALIVPAGSPIRSLADLKGRKIGVAGGALDKSWLILRAEAKRRHGLDLAREAEPIFAAPPLLARKLEAGELDAALLYWTFAARLEARGFTRLAGVGELARGFGTKGDVALVGWLFRGEEVDADMGRFARFLDALDAAGRKLDEPAAWERIRPLMKVEDEASFRALARAFLDGRPKRSTAAEEADARLLWAGLAAVGGAELVGKAAELPAGLYRIRRDGGS